MPTDERERLAAELKRAITFMSEPEVGKRRSLLASPSDSPLAKARAAKLVHSASGSDRKKLRSISFAPSLLDAVIAGVKTQTRRPIRPAPIDVTRWMPIEENGATIPPLFETGERVWVREKWARITTDGTSRFVYESDHREHARWISSRFMPRVAARRFLIITRVEAVRLLSIAPEDAHAEGIGLAIDPVAAMLALWDSIYGATEFAAQNDPWVWAIHFELERKNETRQ